MPFTIRKVHEDWYEDGVDSRENLWRLDFKYDGSEYQAQLFCKLTPDVDEDEDASPATTYESATLFIERDNRIGDGHRYDYACSVWNIAPEAAQSLLAAESEAAVGLMREKVERVRQMPCDRDFIRKHFRDFPGEREAVLAKWADIDLTTVNDSVKKGGID